jgi:hypothetical protein
LQDIQRDEYRNVVWPGTCPFPDFTNPSPQTLPDDVTQHGDGEAVLHAQVHNLYGQLMARTTHEGCFGCGLSGGPV